MPIVITPTLLIAAHNAVKTAIDAGGAAGSLSIYNASDLRLSVLPLTYPCGTVNGTTGTLTITFGARDEQAEASGTASYARLKTSAGVTLIDTIPCAAGSAPIADTCVLSSLTVVSGAPVEGTSFTIG